MNQSDFIFSTTHTLQGYDITSYIGVETAEVVLGTGPISEMFSKAADMMGVRSKGFETKLDNGRRDAFDVLKKKAQHLGANALIGLDIDIMAYEKNRTGMIVTATLVYVEKVSTPVEPVIPAVYYPEKQNPISNASENERPEFVAPNIPVAESSRFNTAELLQKVRTNQTGDGEKPKKQLDLSKKDISDFIGDKHHFSSESGSAKYLVL